MQLPEVSSGSGWDHGILRLISGDLRDVATKIVPPERGRRAQRILLSEILYGNDGFVCHLLFARLACFGAFITHRLLENGPGQGLHYKAGRFANFANLTC